MSDRPTIKILYIAGYGRSGTTLMSIALGQHPAILGAGEITELSRHAWVDNTYCSCGQQLQSCSFWSGVVGRWLPSSQRAFLPDYRKHQLHFESQITMRAMDLGIAKKASFAEYTRSTEDLFGHIVAMADKSVVVDSSKMPSRARALARMAGLDVHVVHMVRDGRGVAWSLAKSYARDAKAGLQRDIRPKSTLRTAIRWAMVNLEAERLQRIVGADHYVRVRYEDFVADPVLAMKRIGDMLGVDLQVVGEELVSGAAMKPDHQIAGNRLRMHATIKMEKDASWHSQMPEPNQRFFTRVCGWLLKRYNYV